MVTNTKSSSKVESNKADKMQLGLMMGLRGDDMVTEFRKVADMGIPTCQLSGTGEDIVNRGVLSKVAQAMAKVPEVQVSAIFVIFEGQRYNLDEGPYSDGFVPQDHCQRRTDLMLKAADLIKDLGVNTIASHIGFIPDDEQDPLYGKFLDTMKTIAGYLKSNGPVTIEREITGPQQIEDIKQTIKYLQPLL